MKKLILAICLFGWMCSCGGGKKNAETQESDFLTDTIEAPVDTLSLEEVEE